MKLLHGIGNKNIIAIMKKSSADCADCTTCPWKDCTLCDSTTNCQTLVAICSVYNDDAHRILQHLFQGCPKPCIRGGDYELKSSILKELKT